MTAAISAQRSLSSAQSLAIELRNVTKSYDTSGEPITTLADITFSVQPQEFVSVLGPSGCGKTTVLKLIAGLIGKTGGSIEVDGIPVVGPQRKIGIVFQVPALMKWRTVLDNVLLPSEILGLPGPSSKAHAEELLALVGLSDFAGRYPHELSGGMQQRVGIARALIHDPSILLLDEPFSALDVMTRSQLNIELLRIWSERRKTSLLITHSIPEAVFLSDRVIVLGPRPARVLDIVKIDLPRPRISSMRTKPEFIEIVDRIGRLIGLEYL
ncbi:MAG: ABC transporter ATP-binding protein [Thermomicrobiales bacterium]